jgi:hypothetical protein
MAVKSAIIPLWIVFGSGDSEPIATGGFQDGAQETINPAARPIERGTP